MTLVAQMLMTGPFAGARLEHQLESLLTLAQTCSQWTNCPQLYRSIIDGESEEWVSLVVPITWPADEVSLSPWFGNHRG